jgi:hypothetical protein
VKRKIYTAKFSNGETIKRETVNRTYTHAYLTFGTYMGRDGKPIRVASSRLLGQPRTGGKEHAERKRIVSATAQRGELR